MNPIVCIGAALVDDTFTSIEEPRAGTSNPAKRRRGPGGVARNVAHHLAQLGHAVELVAHIGEDTDGIWLAAECRKAGIGLLHSHAGPGPTGRYTAILSPGGELFAGAADTGCEEHLSAAFLGSRRKILEHARLVLADCNLGAEALSWVIGVCRERSIPCVIEPVSAAKAGRLRSADLRGVLLLTPNDLEIAAAGESSEALLARGVRYLWKRMGPGGSTLRSLEGTYELAAPRVPVVDVNGAGDAALAGWVHAWLGGHDPREALRYGHALAGLVLQTTGATLERLDPKLLSATVEQQGRP
jgi:pseudouridine kinase